MTKLARTLAVLTAALVLAPAISIAQDDWETEPAPQTPEPETLPPPPDTQAEPAPEAPATSSVPPGQWVYTQQYGWIWMPYSDAYTQVPANGYGAPYVYAYYPSYSCWTWLAAPWVWGIGAWPYFGVYGPIHYAWYGYGWWRNPWRWHYAPSPGYSPRVPRPAHSAGWGARAAPYRGGYRAPAPYGGGYRAPAPYRGGGYRSPAPYRGGSGYQAPAPYRGGASVGRGGSGFAPRPQGAMSGGRGGAHAGGWRGAHGRG